MPQDVVLDQPESDEEDTEDEESDTRADLREAAGVLFLTRDVIVKIPSFFMTE